MRNPHQLLDFYRFSTDSIMDFAQMQIDIINRYSSKPITHNLMTNFTEIDYKKIERQYDFLSFDNYHFGKTFKPWFAGMNFDLMWSLQRKPFTIMEQQPGRVDRLCLRGLRTSSFSDTVPCPLEPSNFTTVS
jgi:beta-galactosidase